MADIASLAADIKETNRIIKINDEYATSEIRRLSDTALSQKDELKALAKRVLELERKHKK